MSIECIGDVTIEIKKEDNATFNTLIWTIGHESASGHINGALQKTFCEQYLKFREKEVFFNGEKQTS